MESKVVKSKSMSCPMSAAPPLRFKRENTSRLTISLESLAWKKTSPVSSVLRWNMCSNSCCTAVSVVGPTQVHLCKEQEENTMG